MDIIKFRRLKLIEILPFFLSRKYVPGVSDCIQILFALYPGLPREFNGVTIENYYDIWQNDRQSAINRYIEFINMCFYEINDKNTAVEGDLILVQTMNEDDNYNYLNIGIYLGDKSVLFIIEDDFPRICYDVFSAFGEENVKIYRVKEDYGQ